MNQDAFEQGIGHLVTSANHHLSFQVKRFTHALTHSQRDALTDELEKKIDTLSYYLRSNDRIAAQTTGSGRRDTRAAKRRFNSTIAFREHAVCSYELVEKAWKCACKPLHRAFVQMIISTTSPQIDLLFQHSADTAPGSPKPWNNIKVSVQLRREDGQAVALKRPQIRFATGLISEANCGAVALGVIAG